MFRMWALLCVGIAVSAGEATAQEDPLPPLMQGRPLTDWVQDLHSPDPRKHLPAVALMAALGARAKPHLPRLRELLEAGTSPTRLAVIHALGCIGGDEAVALLLIHREKREPLVRHAQEAALCRLFPTMEAQVNHLLRLRQHADAAVSQAALEGLRRPGPWRHQAVPILAQQLMAADAHVRREACDALGYFGLEAEPAVPALTTLLRRGKEDYSVLLALGKIRARPEVCVPVLAEVCLDRERGESTRFAAVQALRKFGPAARNALPQLRGLFRDPSDSLRMAGALAHLALGGPAQEVAPVLAELVHSERRELRIQAIQKLQALGDAARAALPALRRAATDRDKLIRSLAHTAVQALEPPP